MHGTLTESYLESSRTFAPFCVTKKKRAMGLIFVSFGFSKSLNTQRVTRVTRVTKLQTIRSQIWVSRCSLSFCAPYYNMRKGYGDILCKMSKCLFVYQIEWGN